MKRPMYHSIEINKANEELAAENLRLHERITALESELKAAQAEIDRLRGLVGHMNLPLGE